MRKATYLRDLTGWIADARLYRVTPSIEFDDYENDREGKTSYIIVSAVVPLLGGGPEVLVFPAMPSGEAINMIEIVGRRGTLDHEEVLSLIAEDIE
jgi:hypothetical protein